MRKYIITALIILTIIVLYNFTFISRHSENYLPEVNSIQKKTGASNIVLVDFTRASCSDRLFIFKNGKPIYSGAVLHGNGKGSTPSKPFFSNKIGSNCSCLGLFKIIGKKKMANGYPALVLQGLDSTNNNAQVRGILIHPSLLVSLLPFELEQANFPLTDSSKGCFTVSYHTYKTIENLHSPVYLYAKYDL